MIDFLPLILFALVCIFLLFGFPVAFTLAGVSIIFALITSFFGVFDLFLLETLPNRIFGVMTNSTLIAVPLFIFMGVLLETSKVADISRCPVIISGGVSSLDDIKKAKSLNNIEGIIVGKAIYDGDIKLEELVREDA